MPTTTLATTARISLAPGRHVTPSYRVPVDAVGDLQGRLLWLTAHMQDPARAWNIGIDVSEDNGARWRTLVSMGIGRHELGDASFDPLDTERFPVVGCGNARSFRGHLLRGWVDVGGTDMEAGLVLELVTE